MRNFFTLPCIHRIYRPALSAESQSSLTFSFSLFLFTLTLILARTLSSLLLILSLPLIFSPLPLLISRPRSLPPPHLLPTVFLSLHAPVPLQFLTPYPRLPRGPPSLCRLRVADSALSARVRSVFKEEFVAEPLIPSRSSKVTRACCSRSRPRGRRADGAPAQWHGGHCGGRDGHGHDVLLGCGRSPRWGHRHG